MDVDDPSAAQSIFHPWTLPWFKPEGHTELHCIQSHTWKWQRSRWISLQGPSGRGILMVQQCPGRHREPQEPWPGCLHLPRGLGQAREALAALCGVGGLTVLIELLQL